MSIVEPSALWRNFCSSGLVDYKHGIRLSRCEWLDIRMWNQVSLPSYFCLDISPIARSHDGGLVGLVHLCGPEATAFYVCPPDEEYATPIANTLGECLVYLIIEEALDCWIESDDDCLTVWNIREWMHRLCPYVSTDFIAALTKSLTEPVRTANGVAFMSREAAEKVLGMMQLGAQRVRQHDPLDAD